MKLHLCLPLVLLASACGGADPSLRAEPAPGVAPLVVEPNPVPVGVIASRVPCVAPLPSDTQWVRSTADGLVVTRGDSNTLVRYRGAGCTLTEVSNSAPPGLSQLEVDVDEVGGTYFVGDEPIRGLVRVDSEGRREGLVSSGRWLAGFSVAPEGDEVIVYGCLAEGLHRRTPEGWRWDQAASVRLAEAGGVGERAVALGVGVVVAAQGGRLVRVSEAGVVDLGSAYVRFGAGKEVTRCGPAPQLPRALFRCGAEVCGVFEDGVAVWGSEGGLVRVVSRDELLLEPGERFERVTGGAGGVYVVVRGVSGEARVDFVP